MPYTHLLAESDGPILILTMNRPEALNALNHALVADIRQAMADFAANDGARVAILAGEGRAWSAGYDLKEEAAENITGAATWRKILGEDVAMTLSVWDCPKPVIAQVHGYCLAGATELAGHCDIVFASEDAQFGHPAGRSLGILPTLSMWPILMGPRKAKEYFFTGDLMAAKEAVEWHLVNRVFPKDQLESETLQYARRVAMVPLDLLSLHKSAVNRYLDVLGFRALEQSSADLDCIAHQTETVKNWMKASREKGLKSALTERDRPFVRK
jgi:enoyl-CoA hydratase